MTSDLFTSGVSKVKAILPFQFRQTVSTANQGDGSQSSGKQTYPSKTLSRSSTNMMIAGSAEPKSDQVAGHVSSLGDSSFATQPTTVNVVLFGETGVGKSSVINLIARKDIAKVSSDVNGCTMQSTRYSISFDDMNFAIFDTIGLEEPQMGVNGYLKAIERAYELVAKLGAAGGIHLLLFCMRGGRITATTQSNYRLFCECLCSTKVPIALVFTGLEREVEMEDWWTRNRTHIEHYGIKSDGHACITAVQDDTPGEDLKYTESQKRIRELLKTCALKNEAFLPEPHSWFAKLGRGMRSFIEKRKNPKRKDVMKVLTHRCKLDPDTARKIADMMEKDDAQSADEPADGEGGHNPEANPDDKDVREVAKENAVNDNPPPNELSDAKIEPHVDGMEERIEKEAANKSLVKAHVLPNQLGDIKAEPRFPTTEREDRGKLPRRKAAMDDSLRNQPGDVKVESRVSLMEGEHQRKVSAKKAAEEEVLQNQLGDPKAESRITVTEGEDQRASLRKKGAIDYSLRNQLGDVEAESRISLMEAEDQRKVPTKKAAAEDVPQNQLGDVKAESRTTVMDGEDQRKSLRKKGVMDYGLRSQLGDVKVESRVSLMEGEDQRKVLTKKAAAEDVPQNQLGDVKAESRTTVTEGEDQRKSLRKKGVMDYGLRSQPGDVKVESRVSLMEGEDQRKVPTKKAAEEDVPQNQLGNVKAESRITVMDGEDQRKLLRKKTAIDHGLRNQLSDVKAESRTSLMDGEDRRRHPRKRAVKGDDVGAEPRIDGGNDGVQHKKYGSGGDLRLGAAVAEQVKQADTEKKSVSSLLFPQRWGVGSQS